MTHGRWLGVLVVAVACARLAAADDPKPLMDAKAFDKLVVDTLRDVHDRGADLYNTKKDYSGAYRLYQGSLVTVRPMLAHRPDTQKIIDEGLAAAEKEPDAAAKAYLLHKTIEDVRANLRGAAPKKPDDTKKPEVKKPDDKKAVDPKKPDDTKKPDDKKPDDKKPEVKKPDDTKKPDDKKAVDPKKPADKVPAVSGKVRFNGKPLTDGVVTFVSLDQPKPKVVTAMIKDGQFAVADGLTPGKYAVAVSAGKDGKELLPQKFTTTDTSGLTYEVKPGANTFDIELK